MLASDVKERESVCMVYETYHFNDLLHVLVGFVFEIEIVCWSGGTFETFVRLEIEVGEE
jgi:hypothetical protein